MVQVPELSRGQQFELRCLGRCSTLEKIPFMNYRDAIELAKRIQHPGWNPYNPPTAFGKGLLAALRVIIGDMLAASKSNRHCQLALYVSVKTPLDQHSGVDAFVVLRDPELDYEFIVTIDVSLNPAKIAAKADIIFGDKEVESIEGFSQNEIPSSLYGRGKLETLAKMLWMHWSEFTRLLTELSCFD